MDIFRDARVFLEGTPVMGTKDFHYCPGVLGGDTCDGYKRVFINARVFLEGTPVMGTKDFHYCPGVLGGDTCDGYKRVFINARVFLEGTPTMVFENFSGEFLKTIPIARSTRSAEPRAPRAIPIVSSRHHHRDINTTISSAPPWGMRLVVKPPEQGAFVVGQPPPERGAFVVGLGQQLGCVWFVSKAPQGAFGGT
ncbi:hypothetical protein Tco_1085163 [Tanacetum coccineum]